MLCPGCDCIEFGTAYVAGLGILLVCGFCGYSEEAAISDVALFIEEHGGWPAANVA